MRRSFKKRVSPSQRKERVADRLGKRAAAGYEGKLRPEPAMQRLYDWLREGPAFGKPMGRRPPAHTGFDGVEIGDPAQGLSRHARTGRLDDFVKFASCMAPTSGENDILIFGKLLEPGIAVDMQDAFEIREMRDRPFSLTVRCKQIDRRRRFRSAPRPLLAGSCPMVWTLISANRALVTGPTPHISSTGKSCRKASSVSGSTTTSPSGLATCEAILAKCLVRAAPIEIGRPSSVRTRRRTALAISAGGPNRCVHPATSAKASSIEIRSTSGVKSLSTLIAASPSRWYSLKWPSTKIRRRQSSRARHAATDAEGLGLV